MTSYFLAVNPIKKPTSVSSYTPSTGASWVDPDPASVEAALDALSARVTTAETQPYTPSTGANWTDPDPTTVAGALDRLAAAVAGLLAGSIP